MKISITNSKLGAKIPSLNLPPIITCRKNAPCAHLCYACKGNFRFPNVKQSHMDNFNHYKRDPEDFFNQVIEYLNGDLVTYKYFRWHSSGDMPDEQYLYGMIRVAKSCPNVKFLAFTKQFEIVNKVMDEIGTESFPNNLRIVFSMWDKDYKVSNPYNFPTTWVDFCDKTKNPDIPELAIPCIGQCWKCQSCWSLQKGQSVVFHQH